MYTAICILQDIGFFVMLILGSIWAKWELIVFSPIGYLMIPFLNEIVYNLFAKVFFNANSYQQQAISYFDSLNKNQNLLPIIYDNGYNLTACGIERLHPFDSTKYQRVFNYLYQNQSIHLNQLIQPTSKAPRGLMLYLGMSKLFLFKLNYSIFISKCVEIPICFLPASILRWRVLNPMMLATQGTIEAAVLSLHRGWAINLSGGYHHACRYQGGGFCIYPDICLAIEHLRKFFQIKRVMIIDLDAHQGNGHERDFIEDRQNTYIIDFYNYNIYPGDEFAKKAISKSMNITSNTSDEKYIQLLNQTMKQSLDEFQPEFVLYNAGTDCLVGDPLGGMQLTSKAVIKRDEIVFEQCLNRKIPITMVLSGGYQKVNAQVISDSIENLNKNLQLFSYQSE